MSNLTARILVALVGIPLILLLTVAGGFYFFGLVAIVSGLALHEYYDLAAAKGFRPQRALGLAFGFCINAAFLHKKLTLVVLSWISESGGSLPLPSMTQMLVILFLLFVPLILLVELFRSGGALGNTAATLSGVCYVSISFGALVGVRELFVPGDFPFYSYFNLVGAAIPDDLVRAVYQWGASTVVSIFAAIWICDSLAYFVGRSLGRHKLFERVSPNKTWEGAIAGFIGALATFVIARTIALPYMSLPGAIVCGSVVGLFGQVGDMVESWLKRDAGVKDSSTLIPGHGGILDRFDSLIFVSPLLFFYLDFIVF